MVLSVYMKFDQEVPIQFEVTFSGQKKIIDNEIQHVSFNFEKKGTYDIEFSQKGINETFSFMQKLMYLLFLPIIGLFAGFSVFGETLSVYGRINPYLITQKITLEIESDTQIDAVYVRPAYDKKQRIWLKPNLLFSNIKNVGKSTINNNIKDFSNCYLSFKRSFTAVCFDVIVFFMVIAFIALFKEETQIFIAFLSLSLSSLFLWLLTIILVKIKIKRLKKYFLN